MSTKKQADKIIKRLALPGPSTKHNMLCSKLMITQYIVEKTRFEIDSKRNLSAGVEKL
jgi:hypothetical protein